jgi:Pentapeptide repeats (8 copies)
MRPTVATRRRQLRGGGRNSGWSTRSSGNISFMKWTWRRVGKTARSVALAGAAIVAAVLALWFLPLRLVDQAGPRPDDAADLTKAVIEERRNVLAGLAAIGAAVTLWYTHQRRELDRDANRTDRYTKAVEQLGDDCKPAVQLGGVYALERVANDSRRDRTVSIEVLSAFVRQLGNSELARQQAEPLEPVRAALDVIGRRPKRDRTRPNLSNARLVGAYLADANLRSADFAFANMLKSDLTKAKLTKAHLVKAFLKDADLKDADLTGADLTGADLTGANLTGANLTGANLTGANLTGANLTDVRYDESTTGQMDLRQSSTAPEPTDDRGRET